MAYVTREELDAHLHPMRDDITEIKGDVKILLQAKYENSFLGGRGQALLIVVVPTVISIIAAVLTALYV